jgi:Ser/Thr protein kinase RdoA (MazF antagonist)
MEVESKIEPVLRLYPDDCQALTIDPLPSTGGFSGAELWRLQSPRGPLCLRRWPVESPSPKRLEFIQAVLWHVDQEGFHQIPLPVETRHHHGYVRHAGNLWELTPWLPGAPDYRDKPSHARLHAALGALARFHLAAASFPLPETGPTPSPGMLERVQRLEGLLAGRLAELASSVTDDDWPQLAVRGRKLIELFATLGPKLLPSLRRSAGLGVEIQPCIRDIWHAHVLFVDQQVSGIVDFGALRPENVAADIARLLGSLAGDNANDWRRGLSAYQEMRPLSTDELTLATAFDRSTVLMGGLQWREWIYSQQRIFETRGAVLSRIDEFLSRLSMLSQLIG